MKNICIKLPTHRFVFGYFMWDVTKWLDSSLLRNILTQSTQIKHKSHSMILIHSRRCVFTYKRVSLHPLNIIPSIIISSLFLSQLFNSLLLSICFISWIDFVWYAFLISFDVWSQRFFPAFTKIVWALILKQWLDLNSLEMTLTITRDTWWSEIPVCSLLLFGSLDLQFLYMRVESSSLFGFSLYNLICTLSTILRKLSLLKWWTFVTETEPRTRRSL